MGGNRLIDLTGKHFGRLTVIERAESRITPTGKKRTMWLCQCECGNIVVVEGAHSGAVTPLPAGAGNGKRSGD